VLFFGHTRRYVHALLQRHVLPTMSYPTFATPASPQLWLDLAAATACATDLADFQRRCDMALAAILPASRYAILPLDQPLEGWPLPDPLLRKQLRIGQIVADAVGDFGYMPMPATSALYGYLVISPALYSPEQAQALATLAAIAGPTARLLEDQAREQAAQQRGALLAAAQRLRDLLDLEAVLSELHTIIGSLLQADNFLIALRREGEWVELAYAAQGDQRLRARQFWRDASGLTGAVLRENTLIATSNYMLECERRKLEPVPVKMLEAQPYAWVGIPLADGAGAFGVIAASCNDPQVLYTSEQAALMALLAREASVPLRNAMLYSRAEEQARQLASLNRIGRIINSSLDPAQVPQLIMRQVQELLDVEEGSMLLRDELNGDLVFTYASGPAGSQLLGQRLASGTGIAGYVVDTGQIAIVNDTRNDQRFYTKPDNSTGFVTKSLLAVPLRGIDRVRGVIEVMNRKDDAPFTDADRSLLESVADQAVIALENARRFAQIDQALAHRARELDRSNDQLRKILRLGNALRAEQPIDDLLGQVAQAISESTGFHNAVIALVHRERTASPYLRRLVAAGPAAAQIERLRMARAPLDRLPSLLRPEFRRSASTYLFDRRSASYVQLWGGSEHIYIAERSGALPGGWNFNDTLCCVMRNSRGELLGLLFVDDPEDGMLPTPDQLQILEIFANQAAVAIENASLYSEQQHNLHSMTALNGLGMAINSTLRSTDQIFELTSSAMVESTSAQVAMVFLSAPDQPEPQLAFATGPADTLVATDLAALARQAIISSRPISQSPPQASANGSDPDTWVAVPLRATREVLGAICVGYAQASPDEADRERLTLFASQAAVAIENIRLFSAVREGRDQLASIMASTHEGMMLVDAAGRVVVANGAFMALTGLPTPEGMALGPLLDSWQASASYLPAEWDRLRSSIELVAAGVEEFAHSQISRRSPVAKTLEWTALQANGDQMRGWKDAGATARPTLLVLRDVTAAKEAEKLRQDLTSMIVHDLRSPLASILTSIDMFFRGVSGEINPVQREILTIAHGSARQLIEMVNLLLDISRLEGGQMPLNREPISVDQITYRATNRLRAIAESKQIGLELLAEPNIRLIYADGELVLRVLQNLLDNALKFSKAGGTIELRVENPPDGPASGPSAVCFAVRDYGVGIEPRDQEKIFAKFSQAGERRGNGSGLGLTFCKLVVEAHGGRIWVESSPGSGTSFCFTLPAHDAA
jgi:K+-sensing histidine kinase KdpD